MQNRDESLLPWPRTPDAIRQMLAEYYRYVSYLDAQIGRVLDVLDASPQGRNTLVVFAADSGVARGSHGLIGKQNLYEHSMRVPLIIAGPGIGANRHDRCRCATLSTCSDPARSDGVSGPADERRPRSHATLAIPRSRPGRRSDCSLFATCMRGCASSPGNSYRYPKSIGRLFDLQNESTVDFTNLAAARNTRRASSRS